MFCIWLSPLNAALDGDLNPTCAQTTANQAGTLLYMPFSEFRRIRMLDRKRYPVSGEILKYGKHIFLSTGWDEPFFLATEEEPGKILLRPEILFEPKVELPSGEVVEFEKLVLTTAEVWRRPQQTY